MIRQEIDMRSLVNISSAGNEFEKTLSNYLNNQQRDILILGKTGSGKTFFLNIVEKLDKSSQTIIDEKQMDLSKDLNEQLLNDLILKKSGRNITLVLDDVIRTINQYNQVNKESIINREIYNKVVITAFSHEHPLSNSSNTDDILSLLENKHLKLNNPLIIKIIRNAFRRRLVIIQDGDELIAASTFGIEGEQIDIPLSEIETYLQNN